MLAKIINMPDFIGRNYRKLEEKIEKIKMS